MREREFLPFPAKAYKKAFCKRKKNIKRHGSGEEHIWQKRKTITRC